MPLDDNEQAKVNPLSPVYLPEFGHYVSWAMCRNPACKNYGIHYQGPAPVDREIVSDQRYRFNANTGQFSCGFCAMSFTLKSNQAIRPFARYYLKLSLPFADCANQQCKNHGVNVFEHYTPWKKPKDRLYSSDDENKVLCRLCNRRFHIGEALQMSRAQDTKEYIHNIVEGVMIQRTVTNTVDVTKNKSEYLLPTGISGSIKTAGLSCLAQRTSVATEIRRPGRAGTGVYRYAKSFTEKD